MRRNGREEAGARVATQGVLEEPGKLRVSERDV